MIRKRAPNIAALTFASSAALLLSACGGGGTTDPDGAVADPAAAPETAEPAAAAAPEAPVTDPMPTGEPAVAVAEPEAPATDTMPLEEPAVAAADGAGDAVESGWTAMQNDWETSAGLVKDRWAELTEEEILGTGGDRDQLVGLVQEKYGIERDQAEQEVSDWAATL